MAILDSTGDITLTELKAQLGKTGGTVSISALSRFFRRHGLTRKKSPATRRNRAVPMSAPSAASGSTAKATSTPRGLHRRDVGVHQDGAHARPLPEG